MREKFGLRLASLYRKPETYIVVWPGEGVDSSKGGVTLQMGFHPRHGPDRPPHVWTDTVCNVKNLKKRRGNGLSVHVASARTDHWKEVHEVCEFYEIDVMRCQVEGLGDLAYYFIVQCFSDSARPHPRRSGIRCWRVPAHVP